MNKKIIAHKLARVRLKSPFFWKRGQNLNADINLTCPNSRIRTVFDVGAHVGAETASFLRFWSKYEAVNVYSFEPAQETYRLLESRFKSAAHCYPIAFGSDVSAHEFVENGVDSSNRIRPPEDCSEDVVEKWTTTLDLFTEEQGVDAIDILKIDTEGFDLEVLKGAERLLTEGRVGFIRVEVGVSKENSRHVSYTEVTSFLQKFSYQIFGVYEQENEFFSKEPQIRRFDLAFISEREIKRNRGYANRSPASLLDIALVVKRIFDST